MMSMPSIRLIPGKLTLNLLKELLSAKSICHLDDSCFGKIEASNDIVNDIIESKRTIYGINTGFGRLANQTISNEDLKQLQQNIVLSHACGTGELLDEDVVTLMLLLKINALAQGFSGVRIELINALLALYNAKVHPCIPCRGSVGASGDLAPLAHLALPLIGVGNVFYRGQKITAVEGLKLANLTPLFLAPKEGLALLNGLQASTAIMIKSLFLTEILFNTAMIAGSMSVDAAQGSDIPFDDRIQQVKGHQAQRDVASIYRKLLAGSEIRESHRQCKRVQDPYSLRCQPQVMGAILHQIRFIQETLEVEINSVSDNPLVFVDEKEIVSGGNFHGEMIAMAADNLALAIAEIGAISERRIALLIDHQFSGLPAFLVTQSGLNSGFMIAHVTAASCASDNKALAHPHSVDSLPTSANQEDHVSMSTNAARRLALMIDNTATIVAIELLAAAQGFEFLKPLESSPFLNSIYKIIRNYVEPLEHDRFFAPDIAIIKEKVLNGDFSHHFEQEIQ